ncbi:MAG: SpoIIE family protein phosphatase [Actinobacteria bacterium]|nr:SpoIIE family protein phosphatase [Actinomycetota bacterium]
MGEADSTTGRDRETARQSLEETVLPRWLFRVHNPVARVVLAVALVGAVAAPFMGHSLPDARPGAIFLLPVLATAALAGWWAGALAGVLSFFAFWFYVIPDRHSFHLEGRGAVVSLASIGITVVAVAVLARRLEQAVDDARRLDDESHQAVLNEARSRRAAEELAARTEGLFWLASALSGADTPKEMAEIGTAHLVDVGARFAELSLTGDDGGPLASAGTAAPTGPSTSTPLPKGLGAITVQFSDPAALTALRAHLDVAAEIIGVSIQRALHQSALEANLAERDRIARTLSTSLLPPRLPSIPPFSVSAWLEPAAADEVAGDFYDVFAAPGGGWVAVIGDVCGKGAEAAAVTSLARYAARTAALEGPDPERVVRLANEALLRDDSDLFCTMAIARFSPADVSALDVAVAGHPRPRLIAADGVHPLGEPGIPLGLFEDAGAESRRRPMQPGDALVLFTDGLVERDRAFDGPALDGWLASLHGQSADEISGAVREKLHSLDAHHRDDVAVVVVRYDGPTAAGTA